jgi:hypothetical protein
MRLSKDFSFYSEPVESILNQRNPVVIIKWLYAENKLFSAEHAKNTENFSVDKGRVCVGFINRSCGGLEGVRKRKVKKGR